MTQTDRPIGDDDLNAWVDGQLAEARRDEVASWLAGNPEGRARVEADAAAVAALRQWLDPIAAEPVPARLRVASIMARRRARWMGRVKVAAAAVLLLATGGVGGWTMRTLTVPGAAPEMAVAEAMSAHRVFVVETVHPVEVPVTQQVHLVNWLSKRVGHALAAPDLSARGFALMGGRVLPAAGNRAAAQFMYENKTGQRLTLYVRLNTGEDTEFRFADAEGLGAFSWVDAGLAFSMVGPLDRESLLSIAEMVYKQLEPVVRQGKKA